MTLEELGFKRQDHGEFGCEFWRYIYRQGGIPFCERITFDFMNKKFYSNYSIDMKLFQAISEKLEELGWL